MPNDKLKKKIRKSEDKNIINNKTIEVIHSIVFNLYGEYIFIYEE